MKLTPQQHADIRAVFGDDAETVFRLMKVQRSDHNACVLGDNGAVLVKLLPEDQDAPEHYMHEFGHAFHCLFFPKLSEVANVVRCEAVAHLAVMRLARWRPSIYPRIAERLFQYSIADDPAHTAAQAQWLAHSYWMPADLCTFKQLTTAVMHGTDLKGNRYIAPQISRAAKYAPARQDD